jgi:hypothetical protein
MAAVGRKRDIAIRVMVTTKEQAEIRKAANKAAMPMSVYVRAKALEASRESPKSEADGAGFRRYSDRTKPRSNRR